MTLSLQEIQSPIAEDLEIFEKRFKESMKTNISLLNRVMTYIVKRKGKQMRPMFVFLVARLCGDINESTYRGAALIELLHTASLVHDDVVDDSNLRRGFFSVNALWKNKIAVLVGDVLLAKGMLLSVDNNDFHLLKIVSESVREMSEGEMLQMEKARSLDITEDVYFQIIRMKTASLISSCCAVGASSSGADETLIALMKDFGEKVGIAFQIKDDLFDYTSEKVIGKPAGIDIKEKKLTLPLIHALKKASWLEKRKIINIIRNESQKPAKVKEVIRFVEASGGIEYATEVMKKYHLEAEAMLTSLPDVPAKQSLIQLVKFTIERSK